MRWKGKEKYFSVRMQIYEIFILKKRSLKKSKYLTRKKWNIIKWKIDIQWAKNSPIQINKISIAEKERKKS